MLEDLLKGEFMKGGEPFYNKASKDLGVLMFHGLAATPNQMRELGDFLYSKGVSNFGACIAGHATKKEDLINTTRKDWLDSARNDYQEFSKIYKKNILLGFSLGGLLVLNLGKDYKPNAIISIGAPYRLSYKGNFLYILGYYKTAPENKLTYVREISLKTKYEIIMFTKDTRKGLHQIESPLLLVQGTADKRVSKKSAYQISDSIQSGDKEMLILPGEEHSVLEGKYKYQVFDKIHEFILQHASVAQSGRIPKCLGQ